MMFPAHHDRFLGAGIDTKSAVDTTHHVDIESTREFFDLRVGVFPGFDVDTFGRADRSAHVTSNTFEAAVITYGEDVSSPEAFGVGALLFRVTDRRHIAFKQGC